jgi:two-component system phosphate regulon sensor histidine kinase PhoR
MYSLRIQLITAISIAALCALCASYLFSSSHIIAVLVFIAGVLLSYGILHLAVVKPIRRISWLVHTPPSEENVQRVIIETSDEFLRLSDALNTMLESFRSDIGRLKKLERVRTEFLGNVSHELRTPIFTTQGLLETLLNGAVDDKKVNKDFLHKALQNTERLNTLLGELIDISRIESGELKLRFRYFDIVQLLQSIVQEIKPAAEQRNITIILDGNTTAPIDVYGDKERLHQVLTNLTENAVKYSESGDTVTVHFEEKKERVEISVIDTGIGIAPQHLPRIFERFYRVDRDRSRQMGGTGLGLAIAKHIVEAHDAELKVKSEVGVGSKFSFYVKKAASG